VKALAKGASQDKERPMKTANYKLQLITPEGKWPYVGNAYVNRNGSISLGGHPKPATDGHLKTGHQM
jgi:hypothetical protein